jgi:hypothetical protein
MIHVVLEILNDPVGGSTVLNAEHPAVAPPPTPTHDHVQGPVPRTVDAVPVVQRFVVGAVLKDCPLEEPQTPFMGVGGALTVTVTFFDTLPPPPVHARVYVMVAAGVTVCVPLVLTDALFKVHAVAFVDDQERVDD